LSRLQANSSAKSASSLNLFRKRWAELEFKTRIASDKKEAKADYNKRIAELEQKNSDMKKKLDDYKADGKDKWEQFKKDFSRDMDDLGNAFKDLTTKKTK
jgi:hypothetical protein